MKFFKQWYLQMITFRLHSFSLKHFLEPSQSVRTRYHFVIEMLIVNYTSYSIQSKLISLVLQNHNKYYPQRQKLCDRNSKFILIMYEVINRNWNIRQTSTYNMSVINPSDSNVGSSNVSNAGTKKGLKCDCCEKEFAHAISLSRHMKLHM